MNDLNEREKEVVGQCLKASAHGPFFPEWEFQTLFSVERNTVVEIADLWPEVNGCDEEVFAIVSNSMGNLIGYPHGLEAEWEKYIFVTREEVLCTLQKWHELFG